MTVQAYTVDLGNYLYWPDYWCNFLDHCQAIAENKHRNLRSVMKQQLRPHGQVSYFAARNTLLTWADCKYHTEFVLRWS